MPSILIDTSTNGFELVAAPSSKQFIRIIGLDITADEPVTVSLKSDNSETKWKSYATADPNVIGGIVLNVDKERTIDMNPGESLNLGLSAAVAVAGSLEYVVHGLPNPSLLAGQ